MALAPNIEDTQQALDSTLSEKEDGKGSVSIYDEAKKEIKDDIIDNKVCISYATTDKDYEVSYKYEFDEHNKFLIKYVIKYHDQSKTNKSIISLLDQALRENGLKLVKDSDELRAGDSITEFEEHTIGEAKNVIIILSDKYFTSPHCMYEWKKIHENERKKNIIYLINNCEKIIRVNGDNVSYLSNGYKGFDLTNKEYKRSLYDRWVAYMQKNVCDYNNKKANIVKYAFDNLFYIDELNGMNSRIRNIKTPKISDEGAIGEIVKSMKECIEHKIKIGDVNLKNRLEQQLNKKSILVVGDNLLKIKEIYEGVDIGKYSGVRLGEYFNAKILEEAKKLSDNDENTIVEWYNNNYTNSHAIKTIEDTGIGIVKESQHHIDLDFEDFDTLLKCGHFDVVILFGYSNAFYARIQELCGAKNIVRGELQDGAISIVKQEDPYDNEKKVSTTRFLLQHCSARIRSLVDRLANDYEKDFYNLLKKALNESDIINIDYPSYLKINNAKSSEEVINQLNSVVDINGKRRRNYCRVLDDADYIDWEKKNSSYSHLSEKKFYYIDVIRSGGKSKFVFSELTLIEVINNFIAAINVNSTLVSAISKCDYVMTVGTNFPNWMMRFIWERLTRVVKSPGDCVRLETYVDNSIVIDNKVKRLLKNNGGVIYSENNIEIEDISRCLRLIKDQYIKEPKDTREFNNVFVSNINGIESHFGTLKKRLREIENLKIEGNATNPLNFIWENTKFDTDESISQKKQLCKIHILFYCSCCGETGISYDLSKSKHLKKVICYQGQPPGCDLLSDDSDVYKINLDNCYDDKTLLNRIINILKDN